MTTSPRPLQVLVIDADPSVAALVHEMLAAAASRPLALTHVTRLAAALEALDAGPPDVIVLDHALPDAGDWQGLTMLRVAAPHTPVVMLAASDDADAGRQGMALGAQDSLVKATLTPEGLWRTVTYAIERQRQQNHLTRLAFHDPLTGLPNRTLLDERLDHALAQARRSGTPLAVLFLDLDGFKDVNDTLGHEAGDALLRVVAARLVDGTRASDTVARLSGDEFVVLLPAANLQAAEAVARKLMALVGAPYALAGGTARVTVSMGISVYPQDGTKAEALIRHADRAMYAAKRQGKNTYAVTGRSPAPPDGREQPAEPESAPARRERRYVDAARPGADGMPPARPERRRDG